MAAPSIRGSTAPGSGLAVTSPAGTQVGDMVICCTWERAGAGIPTHTLQSGNGFVEINSHSHNDGSTDGRLSVAYKIATASGANSYTAYSTDGTGTVYTGCIVVYGHNTVGIVTNSSTQTTNAVPNPPSVTGLTGDFLVCIASGWHLGSAATVTVAPGANYNETWEVAGSVDLEFGLATRAMTGLSSSTEDPPAWTDDVAPNGTASVTFAIPAAIPQTVTPGVLAHTITTYAPTIRLGTVTTPGTASLTTTTYAPVVTMTNNVTVVPGLAALEIAAFAPTVTASDHKTVTPGVLALTTEAFAPTVTASDHKTATPGLLELAATLFAPTVTVSDNKLVTPGVAELALAAFIPSVTVSDGGSVGNPDDVSKQWHRTHSRMTGTGWGPY